MGFLPVLSEPVLFKLMILVTFVLSCAFHEYGHAKAAEWCGDDLPRRQGRVTLNPVAHISWVFTVFLPGFLIFQGVPALVGAGRPVQVDVDKLRHPAFQMMLISVAGPAVNVLLALLATAALHGLVRAGIDPVFSTIGLQLIWALRINLVLAVFNLLPVPPLDGHRVVALFLPRPLRDWWYRASILGLVLLLYLFLWGGSAVLQKHLLDPLGDYYLRFLPDEIGSVF